MNFVPLLEITYDTMMIKISRMFDMLYDKMRTSNTFYMHD